MGVVYHAHYLVWFELGRTELMREIGCAYGELEDRNGIFFPVIEVGARYHRSAHYDEELTVITTLAQVGGVRVRFEYRIHRQDDDATLLASGFTEHATLDRNHRPRRVPAGIRARLEEASCSG